MRLVRREGLDAGTEILSRPRRARASVELRSKTSAIPEKFRTFHVATKTLPRRRKPTLAPCHRVSTADRTREVPLGHPLTRPGRASRVCRRGCICLAALASLGLAGPANAESPDRWRPNPSVGLLESVTLRIHWFESTDELREAAKNSGQTIDEIGLNGFSILKRNTEDRRIHLRPVRRENDRRPSRRRPNDDVRSRSPPLLRPTTRVATVLRGRDTDGRRAVSYASTPCGVSSTAASIGPDVAVGHEPSDRRRCRRYRAAPVGILTCGHRTAAARDTKRILSHRPLSSER